jgi:predicted transcriptional regulator
MAVTGFAFCQHVINIRKPISKQLKATYLDISSRSSKSIYQVARDMNRPYSRVYADVKRLNEMGLVKAKATARDGKRVTLLSAA